MQDDQYRVWWQAERTLLGLSDLTAVPSLRTGLAIPDCRVRAVVARVLGDIGDRRAVEPLLAELEPLRRTPAVSGFAPANPAARWLAIYRYYVIRALGKLGDPRAVPILDWIRAHECEPVLKGKSLGDMATVSLRRIAERTAQQTGGEPPPGGLPQDPA